MRARFGQLSCLTAVCLLAGCAAPAARQGATTTGVASADAVIVYQTPAQVGAHYREVAVLAGARSVQEGDCDALRQRAAALGANAIILDATAEESVARPVAEYVLSAAPSHVARVVAIIVDPTVTADASVAPAPHP
jgi:hypothetical protein